MERSEPTFVPEWYKGVNNNTAGNINSNHNSGSLHSAPDEHNNVFSSRNSLSVSVCDHDAPRSLFFSDKASLSFRRSVSSNGSMGREKDLPSPVCSSFGWSKRDRDRDREKDLDLGDRDKPLLLDCGFSNYPDSLVANTSENDYLRRSHSMVSRRHVDSYLKRPGHNSSNGILSSGMVANITKSTFERDFPSLGVEEKHWGSDFGGVSSLGLSTAINNLPVCASSIIGGDGWTSALAEVPPILGVNGQVVSSTLQTSSALATASSNSTGLSMAETLAQAPGRVRVTTQLPSDSQKIEELHRQQILKLRPVTPSMLKNSGPHSADKSKTKGARIAEFSSSKQQSSSNLLIHTTFRSDVSKTSHSGQFQVLNRERNGFSPTAKDGPNSTNVSRAPSSSGGIPPTTVQSFRGPMNPKLKVDGQGGALTIRSYGEKKIASQAQKRNDFFNSLRNKSSAIQPTNPNDDQSCSVSSSNLDKISVDSTSVKEPSSFNSNLHCSVENGNCSAGGGAFEEPEKLAPDEEEVAFLRSLGWEENAGEEALTREEIESFLSEYKKRKPASNLKL
ncbi:hypothetical protein IEQ34_011059 [Dendrobium chrysotoxum]|uniref:Uncharacterized protein n=1 Tax=Dendrobium chrysotoxum TaxID=161865 RepID=A0AAV7GUG8_DENCH|nr:hypothetical protein IEQ34_011059 [Dendrobium chrysotoxum]